MFVIDSICSEKYVCSSINIRNISMYVFFLMHLPEDGHMSGRNM
jgi:hypothetical protein